MPEVVQPAPLPADDIVAGYRREVERLIHEAAAGGHVIVVGRLGGAILGARPDLVRVFLTAPIAWRIAYVRASLDVDEMKARSEVARIDEARRMFAREAYRVVWEDARNYDLTLDVARYGVSGSAEVIGAAVRSAEASR